MNKKLILVLVVFALILFVVGAAMLLSNNSNNQTGSQTNNINTKLDNTAVKKILTESKNVNLTALGFNPRIITIKPGGRVIWKNQSGEEASVNSNPYPTNSLWKFLNLGLFDNGTNVSVIFEKVGTYTYHNQLKPTQTGTIVVK